MLCENEEYDDEPCGEEATITLKDEHMMTERKFWHFCKPHALRYVQEDSWFVGQEVA